jgi:hypothetical protein
MAALPTWMQSELSFQEGAFSRVPITMAVSNAIALIRNGDLVVKGSPLSSYQKRLRNTIADCYANGLDADGVKKNIESIKKALPAVTWSGTFPQGRKAGLVGNHSGVICVDIDLKPHTADQIPDVLERQEKVAEFLTKSPFVAALFTSPSGYGLKPLFLVKGYETWYPEGCENPERVDGINLFHAAAFAKAKAYLYHNYSSIIMPGEVDEACKDVSRLCFLPHDPALLYNPKPVPFDLTWTQALEDSLHSRPQNEERKPKSTKSTKSRSPRPDQEEPDSQEEQEKIRSALDCLDPNMERKPWLDIGMAIHSAFPDDDGLELWDEWSQGSKEKYERSNVETAWNSFHEDGNANGAVTLGTLFQMAQDAGWQNPGRSRDNQQSEPSLPPIEFLNDFMLREIPKPAQIIEAMIFEKSKTVVASASKVGKTWFLIQLVLSMTFGLPFLGRKVKQGRVLFVNPEVHESFMQDRIQKTAFELEMDLRSVKYQSAIMNIRGALPGLGGNIKGSELAATLNAIRKRIEESGARFDMIVFDSAYKILGGLDENSNTDMRVARSLLDGFSEKVGNPAIIDVFHYSKGNQAEKDELDRIVGAGVVGRDCDTAITITPHERKELGYQSVSVVSRNLPKGDAFVMKLDVPLWSVVEGEDASKLHKTVRGHEQKFSDSDLQKPIIGQENAKTAKQWLTALADHRCDISRQQLSERRNRWGSILQIIPGKEPKYYIDPEELFRRKGGTDPIPVDKV